MKSLAEFITVERSYQATAVEAKCTGWKLASISVSSEGYSIRQHGPHQIAAALSVNFKVLTEFNMTDDIVCLILIYGEGLMITCDRLKLCLHLHCVQQWPWSRLQQEHPNSHHRRLLPEWLLSSEEREVFPS